MVVKSFHLVPSADQSECELINWTACRSFSPAGDVARRHEQPTRPLDFRPVLLSFAGIRLT
jgi:hypothetical protein